MIGQPLRRREDLPLVRGRGRYLDDLDLPGLAHVAFVRSHHARARIVDVRAPVRAPGLLRVLTAADLQGRAGPLQAIDACELVEVEYEPLPPVVDPHDAPETLVRFERTAGEVDGALEHSVHRIRARYCLPRLVAAPIEPRGVMVAHDEREDLLTVW